jgi:WD40 repeat protein
MSDFFVTGGTMKPTAPSYIERAADEQLYNAVLQGEYSSVLTTRQMGKSSLMARTAVRLRAQGISCATVDLQGMGDQSPSQDQWYYGIVKQIATGLELSFDWPAWWKQQDLLLPVQRFIDFLAEVVLEQIPGKVVIFIDEVDWMIKLGFSDEFFAAVRSCFNRRATEPAFERLTFVLLGSAAPAQLIRDATRTPFNIGRSIELTDFTAAEAHKMAQPLGANGDAVLTRILYWTDGHPYLTQMLCSKAAEAPSLNGGPEPLVDGLVQANLLSTTARQGENNLKFVEDRLTRAARDSLAALKVYRDILRGKKVTDAPASAIHTSLRLSGAVKPNAERQLQIRNRVYGQVFGKAWVKENTPTNTAAWATVAIASLIAIFAAWYMFAFPRPYVEQLRTATNDVPYDAYTALQKPFHRAHADDLFEQFWERRGDRDQAILLAARTGQSKRLASLVGTDYPSLVRTFRLNGTVNAVAFSPDGKLVATGSADDTARVFEAATGREVSRLIHQADVYAVAFSPDGKLVATGSKDNAARVFEAATGREVSRLAHQDVVGAVAFSPNGKLVATASVDHTARVFEAATGRVVFRLAHQGVVYAVAFSPDGKLVATGSEDHTARVFEAATGREVSRLAHQDVVGAVAFSPNGKLVATASVDHTARVFETATGLEVFRLAHQGSVSGVAFSPDGKLVATGSYDHTARVFETETGREVSHLAHQRAVIAVAFSSDGKLVATGSIDNTARVFEAATGREVSRLVHKADVKAVAFSPDGKLVATGSEDDTARVFEATTGPEVSRPAHQSGVNTVALSPDNKLVATGSWDNTARVFEAATGREVSRLAHQANMYAVAFSPDNKLVATGSPDNTARVFEAATGREVSRLVHKADVKAVAFSPNGKLVATGSDDSTARVFEAATGREVSRLAQSSVSAVAFSPDGKLVATGYWDNTARVFEAATGREVSRLGDETFVVAIAFSPVGKLVATGGYYAARVFEAATGREVSRLVHQADVKAVAFSPDGKLLVTEAGHWLHLYHQEGSRWLPIANRYLPLIWSQTVHFSPQQDNCPRCIDLIRDVPESMLKPYHLNLNEYPDPPITGDSAHLVEVWSAKLGLTFDSRGHIVPLQAAPAH